MILSTEAEAGVHPEAAHVVTTSAAAPVGNPAMIALPTFLVGGITLGLWLVGYLPSALAGGMIPAVLIAAGLGVSFSAIWAARLGQSAVASIFGIFGMFWGSFGILLAGLFNGWFGLSTDATASAAQIQSVQATFLLSWLIVFIVLTLATLRLPLAFTALFLFVDIAVALVLGGVLNGSSLLLTLGGIAVFIFDVIGVYLYVDGMTQELGGKAMPLGNPIIR
ncbi:MAG: GPR1/FUN34/YaaH family transporter [Sciscionella sp.]